MNEMNDDIPEDDDVFSGLFLFVVCIVAAACVFSAGLKVGKNDTIKELCRKNSYDFCETKCGVNQ